MNVQDLEKRENGVAFVYGWISPRGELHPCDYMEHCYCAQRILEEMGRSFDRPLDAERHLEGLGWVKVISLRSASMFAPEGVLMTTPPTKKQIGAIQDIGRWTPEVEHWAVCLEFMEKEREQEAREASDAVGDLVLSVRPEHAEAIFAHEKTVEYRKAMPRSGVKRIYIHVCGEDAGCVQGYADYLMCTHGSPCYVRLVTKEIGGITDTEFDSYFDGCDSAFALHLSGARRFKEPLPLSVLGLSRAPQSLAYVKEVDSSEPR